MIDTMAPSALNYKLSTINCLMVGWALPRRPNFNPPS